MEGTMRVHRQGEGSPFGGTTTSRGEARLVVFWGGAAAIKKGRKFLSLARTEKSLHKLKNRARKRDRGELQNV